VVDGQLVRESSPVLGVNVPLVLSESVLPLLVRRLPLELSTNA